jgi:hypothetical protein
MFHSYRSMLDTAAVSALMFAIYCPGALAQQPPTPQCRITSIDKLVRVHNVPDHPESYLSTVCLPEPLPSMDDGRVQCEVRVRFDDVETARRVCVDNFHVPGRFDEDGQPYCPLRQLTSEEPLALQGPGFFYDDSSSLATTVCRPPGGQRIGFVPDDLLYVLESFKLAIHCELSHADAGGNDCVTPAQTVSAQQHVGQACSLAPPTADKFSISSTYFGSPALECGSGMCMAYGLNGSIAADCDSTVQTCLTPEAVRRHTRCTCRCSATDPGDAELCACPSGFACQPLLRDGPATSGYCVDRQLLPPR